MLAKAQQAINDLIAKAHFQKRLHFVLVDNKAGGHAANGPIMVQIMTVPGLLDSLLAPMKPVWALMESNNDLPRQRDKRAAQAAEDKKTNAALEKAACVAQKAVDKQAKAVVKTAEAAANKAAKPAPKRKKVGSSWAAPPPAAAAAEEMPAAAAAEEMEEELDEEVCPPGPAPIGIIHPSLTHLAYLTPPPTPLLRLCCS